MLKSLKKLSLLKCLSLQNLLSVLKSQSLKYSQICKSKTSKHTVVQCLSIQNLLSLLNCINVTIMCRQSFDVLWTDVYSYQVSKESSHRFWKRTFIQVFDHIWAWQPYWSCDQAHLYILSFLSIYLGSI